MARIILLLLLLAFLLAPSTSQACPYCTEVLAAAVDDDDPMREARAYNRSVLFMLAVPYVLTATIGLLIYREVRKAKRKQLLESMSPAS
jgi:hypothetical protein